MTPEPVLARENARRERETLKLKEELTMLKRLLIQRAHYVVVAAVLAWAAPAHALILDWQDTSSTETGFRVERGATSAGPFTEIGTVGANVTTYTDAGAPVTSCYRVRAYADTPPQVSGYSNIACGQAASLSVSPTTVAFALVAGGALPATQTVTVTVPTGQAWATADGMSFANVGPTAGTGPGAFVITPTAGMGALAPGVYTDTITVTSAGQTATVTVTVQVVGALTAPSTLRVR